MAPGDRPLDFQIPPAADRDADLALPAPTLDVFIYFPARASFGESLPLVRLDKEVQVEVVHALLDVVPVRSDQFLVVVDLRLQRSNYKKKKKKSQQNAAAGARQKGRGCGTFPKRWLMMVSGRA